VIPLPAMCVWQFLDFIFMPARAKEVINVSLSLMPTAKVKGGSAARRQPN